MVRLAEYNARLYGPYDDDGEEEYNNISNESEKGEEDASVWELIEKLELGVEERAYWEGVVAEREMNAEGRR